MYALNLIVNSRNSWGGEIFERLIDSCELTSNEATIRLYAGTSFSALDGPWWTLTYDEKGISRERQFQSTDINPAIEKISCNNNSIDIHLENDSLSKRYVENLKVEEIKQRLINIPIISEHYGNIIVKRHYEKQEFGFILLLLLFSKKIWRFAVKTSNKTRNEMDGSVEPPIR